jgi:hypothetical protein
VSNPVPVPASPDLAEALQALSIASGLPVHMVLDRVLSSTQPGPRRSTHRRSRTKWLALVMAGVAAAAMWPALSGRRPRWACGRTSQSPHWLPRASPEVPPSHRMR